MRCDVVLILLALLSTVSASYYDCPGADYIAKLACTRTGLIAAGSPIECDVSITVRGLPIIPANITDAYWYIAVANIQYWSIMNQQWKQLGMTDFSGGWLISAPSVSLPSRLDAHESFMFSGQTKIPMNAAGMYYAFMGLGLQVSRDSFPMCYPTWNISASQLPLDVQYMSIMNNPIDSDTLPPRVIQYNPVVHDGNITLSVYVLDASPIVLVDAWNTWQMDPLNYTAGAIDCHPAVWTRVSIAPADQGLGSGWYRTSCIIPVNARPGEYHLTMLNLFDVYHNTQDYLPSHATNIVTITISTVMSMPRT